MTDPQRQALDNATALLSEHFAAVLIGVLGDSVKNPAGSTAEVFWIGGPITARGIAEHAVDVLRAEVMGA